MTQKLFCIKLGGSVIADKTKPYTARKETICALARALKTVKTPMLISHGVGSFAHTSAQRYGGKKGYTSRWGIAKVSRDAQEINRILIDIFLEEKLPVISFSPRAFLFTEQAIMEKSFLCPLHEALSQKLIPVIHGDVIFDKAQKTTIFSGEKSLHLLIRYLRRNAFHVTDCIQLTNVDGVLDAKKKVIREITPKNWPQIRAHLQSMSVIDVTGGMKHKVEEALLMTQFGITTRIINGTTNDLSDLFGGDTTKGTLIHTNG